MSWSKNPNLMAWFWKEFEGAPVEQVKGAIDITNANDITRDITRDVTGMGYYKLIDGKIVPCNDLMEWAQWSETHRMDFHLQDIIGDARISTVFIGLDHGFIMGGPPVIFETMVFGGLHDDHQRRYCTIEEARTGHARVVNAVRTGEPLDEE